MCVAQGKADELMVQLVNKEDVNSSPILSYSSKSLSAGASRLEAGSRTKSRVATQ